MGAAPSLERPEHKFVDVIKQIAQKTKRSGVISGIGGFSALFEIPVHQFQNPVIVSSADSIGRKRELAERLKQFDSIGIDLVALCVNNLLPYGAEPFFFQDYFTKGPMPPSISEEIMQGISKACLLAGTSLVGGKTHEMSVMPMVQSEVAYEKPFDFSFDLAGFAVGIVEKSQLLEPRRVKSTDIILGLPSSGVHCQDFSLIFSIIEKNPIELQKMLGTTTIGEALLEPTRIYATSLVPLFKEDLISGVAHITEGGLTGNLPRILPKGLEAVIDLTSYELPLIFQWIKEQAQMDSAQILNIFNCGVGIALIIAEEKLDEVLAHLRSGGEQPWILGYLQSTYRGDPHVEYEGAWAS